jgi:signal peptide peptidase SppA
VTTFSVESRTSERLGFVVPFGDLWMVAESATNAFQHTVEGVDAATLMKMQRQSVRLAQESGATSVEQAKKRYTVKDGVGYISMTGAMTKHVSCMSSLMGEGASTTMTRLAVRAAAKDDKLHTVLLHIESPGGNSDGAFDLADDVWELRQKKHVVAYGEDVLASAAYLVASQAHEVHCNSNAALGSIGVYTVLQDTSRQMKKQGVVVHVVKAGRFKGAGVRGQKVIDEHLEAVQQRVDAIHELFVQYVARGRGFNVDQMTEVANARVFIGKYAVAVGLADSVSTLDSVHNAVVSAAAGRREEPEVADKNTVSRYLGSSQQAADRVDAGEVLSERKKGLLRALKAANITTDVQLAEVVSMASVGKDMIGRLRSRVKSLSVVAMGAQTASTMSASIDSGDYNFLVSLQESLTVTAQAKGLLTPDGKPVVRRSAPRTTAPQGQPAQKPYGPQANAAQSHQYGSAPVVALQMTEVGYSDDNEGAVLEDAQQEAPFDEAVRHHANMLLSTSGLGDIYRDFGMGGAK